MTEYIKECRDCNRYKFSVKEGKEDKKCGTCGGTEFKKFEMFHVDTSIPRLDIWNIIDYYSSKSSVEKLLEKRKESNFFNLNIESLNEKRIRLLGEKEGRHLIELNNEEKINITNRFIKNLFVAKELFNSAEIVPLSTKPMILYYGALTLVEALILITFKEKQESHGFENNYNRHEIKIYTKSKNASTLLYDCVTPTAKYLEGLVGGINKYKIIDIEDVIYTYSLCSDRFFSYYRWFGLPEKNDLKMPMIFLLFTILYYFSIISRYHPLEWQKTIDGSDPNSFLNKVLIKIASIDFPILFLNAIDDKFFIFSSVCRTVGGNLIFGLDA